MLISVAVPVPSLDLLTYAVPAGGAMPCVGARVVVPLGTRIVTGIVVEVNVAPRTANVKAIRDVLDPGAFTFVVRGSPLVVRGATFTSTTMPVTIRVPSGTTTRAPTHGIAVPAGTA